MNSSAHIDPRQYKNATMNQSARQSGTQFYSAFRIKSQPNCSSSAESHGLSHQWLVAQGPPAPCLIFCELCRQPTLWALPRIRTTPLTSNADPNYPLLLGWSTHRLTNWPQFGVWFLCPASYLQSKPKMLPFFRSYQSSDALPRWKFWPGPTSNHPTRFHTVREFLRRRTGPSRASQSLIRHSSSPIQRDEPRKGNPPLNGHLGGPIRTLKPWSGIPSFKPYLPFVYLRQNS